MGALHMGALHMGAAGLLSSGTTHFQTLEALENEVDPWSLNLQDGTARWDI